MKNFPKSHSLIIAAAAAGVALFQLANSAFVAALPGDVLAAIGISAAVIGLAVYDYSRRYQPLSLPNRVLRPVAPACTPRSAAYGAKSGRKERLAA
jgi:hypothetical protein